MKGITIHLAVCWFTLGMCHGTSAEVHKCVGDDGSPVYQDTTCRNPADERTIDTRFANTLPLRFSEQDARVIREIAHEQQLEQRRRIDQRDRRIDRAIRKHEAKEARCRELTRRYNELQRRQRRVGTRDPQAESDLIKRKRDACSA